MYRKEEKKRNNAYEIVKYANQLPFRIHNITKNNAMDSEGKAIDVLEHWHKEVEFVYTFAGQSKHYIDGRLYTAREGSLFVINSESIHKVITDVSQQERRMLYAVVLMVKYEFMESIVTKLNEKYFYTDIEGHYEEIKRIMTAFSKYADENQNVLEYERYHLLSLFYELMYLVCEDSLAIKDTVLPINSQKNIERLRGIISYINCHYKEPIRQHDIAEKFYFTKEYFSRFFKKNTGMTFKEYLVNSGLLRLYEMWKNRIRQS